jgi:heat shock protein HtpX
MFRIGLFLVTNLAVLLVASVVLNILGVDRYISSAGLNLQSLLIYCAVFGFTGSFISLFLSKTMAKWSMKVQVIAQPENREQAWLLETVQALSTQAGIQMPEVGIFPSHDSNAFATGWNKNAALVAVSEGLLSRFRPDEVKAVLAHEIAHVANGDMVTLSLVQGVINTFVMFFARIIGYAVDSFLRRDNEEGSVGWGYYISVMVAEIFLGVLASMIVAWFSRYREFRADSGAASLVGKHSIIQALARLKQEQEVHSSLPESLQAFGLRAGGHMGWMKLLATHPPLDDRIKALEALSS